MGRFEHLEFDGQSRNKPLLPAAVTVSDENRHLQRARDATHRGLFEPALREFSKVLEFNPLNPDAWSGQVRMLIELGEYREASLWADKGLEKLPSSAELLAAKAVALARLGDTAAALTYSDNAMAVPGETAYVWLSRGDVFLSAKESRFSDCFDRAFQLSPADWVIAWMAARICAFYQKFALALKHAQKAVELDSARAIAWAQLGQCQMASNLAHLAEKSIRQARELDPQCPAIHDITKQLGQMGLWQRVRFHLQRFLST